MNPLTKIKLLRFTGYVIDFTALALILYALYTFMNVLLSMISQGHFRFPDLILSMIQFVILLFIAIAIDRLGKYVERERLQVSDDLDKEVIGTINTYGTISLQELSQKFSMRPEEVEKLIGRLSAEGKFCGTIDRSTMTVRSRYVVQENMSAKVLDLKYQKLKMLEKMFKEGKISEEAYAQLKREYESELSS